MANLRRCLVGPGANLWGPPSSDRPSPRELWGPPLRLWGRPGGGEPIAEGQPFGKGLGVWPGGVGQYAGKVPGG